MAPSLPLRSWPWLSSTFLWLLASASGLCSELGPQISVLHTLLPDHVSQSQAGCPETQHPFWGHDWSCTTKANGLSVLAWFSDIGSNSLGQEGRYWVEKGMSKCFPTAWTTSHPQGNTGAQLSKHPASPVRAVDLNDWFASNWQEEVD